MLLQLQEISQKNSSLVTSFCLKVSSYQKEQEHLLILGLISLGFVIKDSLVKENSRYFYCTGTLDTLNTKKQEELLSYLYCYKKPTTRFATADSINTLFANSNLSWRELMLIKAYLSYLIQNNIGTEEEFTKFYTCNIDSLYVFLSSFRGKFDPQHISETFDSSFISLLSQEDNICLRALLDALKATVRTNFYQNRSYISFKIMPRKLNWHKSIQPLYEFFLYSEAVIGIHMRFHEIARGGIRASERLDLRAEVLSLAQAQVRKNAHIVPSGAKGAFFDLQNDITSSFTLFIQALLEISDNIVDQHIVKPLNLVIYDNDDPYLVVAADKGTSNFSDLANQIANNNNFWLNDAFASGGSNGYNHKKIGITSLGTFEIIKNHFNSLKHNIETTPFTVIGIGDMSGDVFGNAMLLSSNILLLGAFNKNYIFIDPNPDKILAFQERERLFKRCLDWSSYNKSFISKGGGIFLRSSNSIQLDNNVKQLLNTNLDIVSGNELIKLLLSLKVDLLFNGGIGTYIQSSQETLDYDVDNMDVRIHACNLQCKVLVEGGNLGVTDLGRLEFAQRGGLINTDFFDNAAAVMCSDYEVNIKILLRTIEEYQLSFSQYQKKIQALEDLVVHQVLKGIQTKIQINQHIVDHIFCHETCSHISDILYQDHNCRLLLSSYDTDKFTTDWHLRPKIANLVSVFNIFIKKLMSSLDLSDIELSMLHQYFGEPLATLEVSSHPIKHSIAITVGANLIIEYINLPLWSTLTQALKVDSTDILQYSIFCIKRIPIYFLQNLKLLDPFLLENILFINIYSLNRKYPILDPISSCKDEILRKTIIYIILDSYCIKDGTKSKLLLELIDTLGSLDPQDLLQQIISYIPDHYIQSFSNIRQKMPYTEYILCLKNMTLIIEIIEKIWLTPKLETQNLREQTIQYFLKSKDII